jgi:membrane protease subunit (stomatin/prohibitin family)
MGLVQAAFDSMGGTLADQWRDFYTVPERLSPTAALFGAVPRGTNSGRGANVSGSTDVITNGSKIVVPEGYGLILMQDGAITGFASDPGGYEWNSDAQDSQSIFADGGFVSPLLRTSWERFKFGGRPQAQQRAYFVSLKELPNNKFGTTSEVYWDDSFIGTQVGAMVRGSYTMRIADPILFLKNLVPASYLQSGATFDFTDLANDVSTQLFNEVISSLAPAFARYANDPAKENRITRIQQDSLGFAQSLSEAVESGYGWRSQRGLEIVSSAIVSIEYDQQTRELLSSVQRADALSGARGNSNLQASVAQGLQAAGEQGGAAGLVGIGMATNVGAGLAGLQQPTSESTSSDSTDDAFARLSKFKQMLDGGLITQEDYDEAKRQALGL